MYFMNTIKVLNNKYAYISIYNYITTCFSVNIINRLKQNLDYNIRTINRIAFFHQSYFKYICQFDKSTPTSPDLALQ